MEDRCIACGGHIPEGNMVCINCRSYEPSFDTIKITVSLSGIRDIFKFVRLVSKCRDSVVAKSGLYSVNAKSLFGIFSLDLSRPLKYNSMGIFLTELKKK